MGIKQMCLVQMDPEQMDHGQSGSKQLCTGTNGSQRKGLWVIGPHTFVSRGK